MVYLSFGEQFILSQETYLKYKWRIGELKYSSKKWFIQLEHFCLLQTIHFACIFGSDNRS